MNLFFFAAALFAEIVGTIAGFGSSTIFLPLAIFFVDFKTALVLVAFLHIFGNLGRISFFRYGLERRLLVTFGVPSVVGSIGGALLVPHVSQDLIQAFLGVFLVLYAVIFLWREELQFAPRAINAVIGGSLSGFLAGLIGTGGALRGAFLNAFRLNKEKYIATAAAIALAVDVTRIPVYLQQGFLERQYYSSVLVLFFIALIGSFIGKRVVDYTPQRHFRKLVLLAVLVAGLKFLYDWVA
ncbi:MAG: sulfite exporter TauE/SafE family protein [Candidatus Andersenbacteria bacterium]